MSNISPIYSLITFASYWGSKFGGINAFNADLLKAMAAAYVGKVNIICVVNEANAQEIKEANNKNVTLLPLPFKPDATYMGEEHALSAIQQLKEKQLSDLNPLSTIWLGHDRITGAAAICASQHAGGRSALIHHMSYDHYEDFAESSKSADEKTSEQITLFGKADILIAVGPVLKDALEDNINKDIDEIIPGLANIEPKITAPNTFSMFVSGRLSPDSERVKQGQLAIAAIASSHYEAKNNDKPESLVYRPKITLRGVDFESAKNLEITDHFSQSEEKINDFSYRYAKAQIIIKALPYTTDRARLFDDLKKSSVAAMPSWHEGFGLVGWEAISAGVPLIISKESGVYKFIKRQLPNYLQDDMWPVTIGGSPDAPYFSENDLEEVNKALNEIALDPQKARHKALRLRDSLLEYTWPKCAESVAKAFNWNIEKGQIAKPKKNDAPPIIKKHVNDSKESNKTASSDSNPTSIEGLKINDSNWSSDSGIAPSVLLTANEAVVPFDTKRNDDLNQLISWAETSTHQTNIQLITGDGGSGKTRLALELCKKIDSKTWISGFLEDSTKIKPTDTWEKIQNQEKNTLIVIDYVESRPNDLCELITLTQSLPKPKNKVCILLLARDGGEWWENLFHKSEKLESLLTSKATIGPTPLPALYSDINDKLLAYKTALIEFSKILDIHPPEIHPDLDGEHYSKPLYIQMSALLALHGEQVQPSDLITKGILNHEKRYWEAATNNISTNIEPAKYLLALATLIGGVATPKEAKKYWNSLDDTGLNSSEFRKLFNCLVPLYPGHHGLQAIKPDLLGEELIAESLSSTKGGILLDAALSKETPDHYRKNALIVLSRITIKKPATIEAIKNSLVENLSHLVKNVTEIAITTDSKLPELIALALHEQPNNNTKHSMAKQFSLLIRDDSLALNIVACKSNEIIYERLNRKHSNLGKKVNSAKTIPEDLAEAAFNYSLSLAFIGKSIPAIKYSKQAMDLLSQLNKQDSEKYQSFYAESIGNHANRLQSLGKTSEAAEHCRKALDIYDSQQHKIHNNHLSISLLLGNYSVFLGQLERPDEAIKHSERSLDLIIKMIESENSDSYQPNYSSALVQHAAQLSEIGKDNEALDAAKKAMKISKQLADQTPDTYLHQHARTTGLYATLLKTSGKNNEAITHAENSMKTLEKLSIRNTARYQPEHANSISNYATHLRDIGEVNKSIKYAKRSVEIQTLVTERNPDINEENHVNSIITYALSLRETGDHNEALIHHRLGNNLLHKLYHRLPLKHALSLAESEIRIEYEYWIKDIPYTTNKSLINQCTNHISTHNKNKIYLCIHFMKAINEISNNNRNEVTINFISVLNLYNKLTLSQQISTNDYWHCACLWIFSHDKNYSNNNIDYNIWVEKFNTHQEQRKKITPGSMSDFSKKTNLPWPNMLWSNN